MADEPWFIVYKRPGHRHVVARHAKGYWLTAAFVLAMALPGVLIGIVQELWLLWVALPWMALSLFVFLRLIFKHSETVPIDEAVELWRKQQGKRRR